MKKAFLLLIFILLFVSCWNEKIQTKINSTVWDIQNLKTETDNVKINETKWVIQDTRETINDYTNTLEWSIKDAKAIKDLYDENNKKLQEDINKLYKTP